MLGLSGISKYLMAGMGVAILIMATVFYLYYNTSQATIASLNQDVATAQANVATLKGATAEQNKTILRIEAQRAKDQRRILELNSQNREFSREAEELRAKFRKHDLEFLSLKKPGLIEKVINRGTAKLFDDLEDLTKEKQLSE